MLLRPMSKSPMLTEPTVKVGTCFFGPSACRLEYECEYERIRDDLLRPGCSCPNKLR